MAHYANDCWDGEVETSYGWIECVGLADRSAYDLTAHAGMSKQELTAHEKFPEPRIIDTLKVRAVHCVDGVGNRGRASSAPGGEDGATRRGACGAGVGAGAQCALPPCARPRRWW